MQRRSRDLEEAARRVVLRTSELWLKLSGISSFIECIGGHGFFSRGGRSEILNLKGGRGGGGEYFSKK